MRGCERIEWGASSRRTSPPSRDLILEDPVAEFQIVIIDQVVQSPDRERHPYRDADRADRKKLYGALDENRTCGPTRSTGGTAPFAVGKKLLARTALAGIHSKLRDGLTEQCPDRLARHSSHIERVEINRLSPIPFWVLCHRL